MRLRLKAALLDNWPMKVTALALAAILWAVTASEEPTTQLVPVRLVIEPPEGRAFTFDLPPVQALYRGPARELIKLFGSPPEIRHVIPDTATSPEYTLGLSVEDLVLTLNAGVQAEDVQPRVIHLSLDDMARKTVPVVSRVSITPEPGYEMLGSISIIPDSLVVTGPRRRIETIDSLVTVSAQFNGRRSRFGQLIDIDTTALGVVTLSRSAVMVSAEIGRITERVLVGIPLRIRGDPTISWLSTPPAITVTARGPASRLTLLTRDSVEAIAIPRSGGQLETVPISVLGPAGLEFTASPDSAVVQSRDGA